MFFCLGFKFFLLEAISQQVCVIMDMNENAVQVGFLLHKTLKNHVKVSTSFLFLPACQNKSNFIFKDCQSFYATVYLVTQSISLPKVTDNTIGSPI